MISFLATPKPRARTTLAGVAVAIAAVVPAASPAVAGDDSPGTTQPDVVAGELLVTWAERAPWQAVAAWASEQGAEGSEGLGATATQLLRFPAEVDLDAVLAAAAADPLVAHAERNRLIRPSAVSGVWALDNTGQTVLGQVGKHDVDIDAPLAQTVTTGSRDVIVAIIDTGTDISHPDLSAAIWTNPGEIAGNGIDDDANGYVDDVNGWDFFNGDATVYDATDGDRHGTHVSGSVAAANATGIGVAPGVTIMPLKFLGPESGSTAHAIAAIQYAKAKGADIINASWGSTGSSSSLRTAISDSGLLFVAAAGNGGVNTDAGGLAHYPSGYDLATILSVTAVDNQGNRPSFANTGATSVDLGAPGASIRSTLPGTGYGYLSGTSMAAPHVAGVAALELSRDPTATATQLASRIRAAAIPLASMSGVTVTGGLLNAAATLGAAVAPAAPAAPGVTSANTAVDLTWQPPLEDGAAVVSSYAVSITLADGSDATATVTGTTTRTVTGATATRFDGLTNDTAYRFTLAATNAVGTSTASATSAVATPGVVPPSAPQSPSVTAGNGQLVASWSAPADAGGSAVTGYTVTATPASGAATTVAHDATEPLSATVTGLTNGVLYDVTVTATNAAGTSTPTATVAATPRTVPGAPTGVSGVAGDGQISLSWSPPADTGGATVTDHTVTVTAADGTAAQGVTGATTRSTGSPSSSYTFTGLANGVGYRFTVAAVNAAGTGAASEPSATSTPVVATPAPTSGGGGGGGAAPAPAPTPTPTPTPAPAPGGFAGTVPPRATARTDTAGTGATPSAPVQTALATPTGGTVEIATEPAAGTLPPGLAWTGTAVRITAPAASAADPLVIEFALDALDAATAVTVFRNGLAVAPCTATAPIVPDPCLSATASRGDDLALTVLTSRASVWTFAVPTAPAAPVRACSGREPAAGFADVATGNVHRGSIACAVAWGLARGLSDASYAPRTPVTRAQMATFVANTVLDAGATLPAGTDTFADDDRSRHEPAIRGLAAVGIVTGVGPGRFAPDEVVSRGQMASFLVRAYAYVTGAEADAPPAGFTDTASSTHRQAIDAVAALGITAGVTPDRYDPSTPVARDQLASFLVRTRQLL